MFTTELFCEACNAEFRNQCTCNNDDLPLGEDRWVGFDGHAYKGNIKYPSAAMHDVEKCRCPRSPNFDPDSWY